MRCAVVVERWDSVVDTWMRPPRMNRQLYLLIQDEQVQAADSDDMLYQVMLTSLHLTVVEAKKLYAYSKKRPGDKLIFEGVPVAARDRFLQLVAAAKVTGEQHCIYVELAFCELLHHQLNHSRSYYDQVETSVGLSLL